jgi:hypothetical protein
MKPQSENCSPVQFDAAMLLDIFEEPIVIQRNFLRLTGNLNSAMLLSWIVTLSQDQEYESDGWLRLTQATWQQDTGLSRFELESARAALRKRELIEERRKGLPAKTEIRLDVNRLTQALREQAHRNYPSLME